MNDGERLLDELRAMTVNDPKHVHEPWSAFGMHGLVTQECLCGALRFTRYVDGVRPPQVRYETGWRVPWALQLKRWLRRVFS